LGCLCEMLDEECAKQHAILLPVSPFATRPILPEQSFADHGVLSAAHLKVDG
jgi:hypothetical protein